MSFVLRCLLPLAALLLLSSTTPSREDAPALLNAAEKAYRSGDYESAAKGWESYLSRMGAGDARVEYNLGNCAFRLGDYAVALWRYERAGRILRDSDELRFNARLARNRLGIGADETQGFVGELRDGLARWRSGDWLWAGLSVELLGLLVLGFGLARRRALIVVLGAAFALAGSAALVRATKDTEPQRLAIVFEQRTPVFAEPRDSLEPRARLGAGVSVRVLELAPAWIRVEGRGTRGWVERERLGLY